MITETIPSRVAKDTPFKNAKPNSDRENARIEHDRALVRVMTSVMEDDTELFKQFMDNPGFKRWMTDKVFGLAYGQGGGVSGVVTRFLEHISGYATHFAGLEQHRRNDLHRHRCDRKVRSECTPDGGMT